jgi:hypothetical protein
MKSKFVNFNDKKMQLQTNLASAQRMREASFSKQLERMEKIKLNRNKCSSKGEK